ncbi:MAG TPA: hypothetical protein VJW20_13655 [Candidatus Angelobacter sp.]|nr:hypothetical protein [Candidatus Angelobacter sp.]
MHYILFYDVRPDYVKKRGQFRDLHLKHARAAYDRGELLLGGALADPVDGAILVFRGDSPAASRLSPSRSLAPPCIAKSFDWQIVH